MLTAIILTKNEEKNIEKCIESLRFCDEIVVVDDGSVDNTVKIAKKLGVRVVGCKMQDFSSQRNWAIEQIKSNWILFVDADEIVNQELGDSIQEAVKKNDANGYLVQRVDHIWNHKFKYGDVGNVWLLRLARRGAGQWLGEVHERWEVDGRIEKLVGELSHYPHQTVVEFLKHINNYSTLKANEFYKNGRKTNILEIVFGSIYRFVYLYICRFGFLDGTAGFVHAMLMSFYMFLVAGKLYLLYKGIPHGQTPAN
ncbi:glycosyltransferase family 2 protein [Candidatus Amesbacteria bacterium]|nr:glycosyltransferase family 2 protein [Candidatus Amesbacteria bacterium]